jgi:GT2 family glycosyltransferase
VRGSSGVRARISFITVQYNNKLDTTRFVSSVADLSDNDGCDVVVVDNSTSVEMQADARTLQGLSRVPVKVLLTGVNLYYWGAAAFAIDWMLASGRSVPDWIVVCNNDVTIEDPHFIRKVRALDTAKFPIVAPRITSSAGTEQNPLLESPPHFLKRLKWRIYDIDYRIARVMLWLNKAVSRTRPPKPRTIIATPKQIYAPHGAFLLLSSDFFRRGGTLDTTIPLFAEELTLAVTAIRLGLPVWYFPDIQIAHREHSTTGRELTRSKYELERRARRRYYSLLKGAVGSI